MGLYSYMVTSQFLKAFRLFQDIVKFLFLLREPFFRPHDGSKDSISKISIKNC